MRRFEYGRRSAGLFFEEEGVEFFVGSLSFQEITGELSWALVLFAATACASGLVPKATFAQ
jgi:hypothetical protein